MIKLRLKRKVSGKIIRKTERHKRLFIQKEYQNYDGKISTYEVPAYKADREPVKWPRKRRNKDNSRRYDDSDQPVGSFYAARLPRKGSRAMKRFQKLFPQVGISPSGGKVFVEYKAKVETDAVLHPTPKKGKKR